MRQNEPPISWRTKGALALAAAGYGLSAWCLIDTSALSMTLFFTFGLPLFGMAAVLYIADVLLDLRRHRVL